MIGFVVSVKNLIFLFISLPIQEENVQERCVPVHSFFLSVSLTNPGPFQKQRSTRAEVALCGVDCILSTHANNEEEETLLSLSLSSSNTDIYQRYNQSIIPESSL